MIKNNFVEENKKPTIGLIIGQLTQGGAERQITKLAIELQKNNKFKPVVFCLSRHLSPYASDLTNHGICWTYPKNFRFGLFKLIWLILEINKYKCSLLYGFLMVGNIYAGFASKVLGLPLITSMRSANSAFDKKIRVLAKIFFEKSDMIVANSKACVKILREEIKVTNKRTIIIPNIIDPIALSEYSRKNLHQKWSVGKEPVVGTIALIKKSKRPDLFFEIFEEINKLQPVHFVWVGDGAEKFEINNKIANYDLFLQSRIHMEGNQKDISSYLSAFDIFILTSSYEGSPNSILEAMSAGKVFFALNVPGISDFLTEEIYPLGFIVEDEDPRKLAYKLKELIENEDLKNRISENAKLFIQKNNLAEEINNKYDNLFERILERAP